MADCYPFIKYVYVSILFIFAFLALFSQHMQSIGFGALVGLNAIYTILVLFDIFTDGKRDDKALVMEIPTSKYMMGYNITLPYWWILVPCVAMQFAATLLMSMTWNYLSKRADQVQLSRSNEIKVSNFKVITLFLTIFMLCLTYSYVSDFNATGSAISGVYQLWITLVIMMVLVLSISNIIYANGLSKLRFTSTDG